MVLLYIVGILAAMRPCGVIVLVTELFIAESKTQVYGCLHNYLARFPNAAKELGKHNSYTPMTYS